MTVIDNETQPIGESDWQKSRLESHSDSELDSLTDRNADELKTLHPGRQIDEEIYVGIKPTDTSFGSLTQNL